MWTVSSSACVRVCVGSVCVLSDFLFFFLASLPVFLWLSAKWHKKLTDTYYAEHQRRALEGVHPREAYPATHNYTLIQLNQRRDGENRLDLWLSTPADLQDILNVFTKPTHTDSCAPVITQQHSQKPGRMILTVSFSHFFVVFFFFISPAQRRRSGWGSLTGFPGYPGWPGWPGKPSWPGNPRAPTEPMWPTSPFFPSVPLGPTSPVTPFWGSGREERKSRVTKEKRRNWDLFYSHWWIDIISYIRIDWPLAETQLYIVVVVVVVSFTQYSKSFEGFVIFSGLYRTKVLKHKTLVEPCVCVL